MVSGDSYKHCQNGLRVGLIKRGGIDYIFYLTKKIIIRTKDWKYLIAYTFSQLGSAKIVNGGIYNNPREHERQR